MMKKVLTAIMALTLLVCLSACGSSTPASENNNGTENTDTPVSMNENNELNYTFENQFFIIRFTEQEAGEVETILYYTIENLSDKEVYVKYRGWKDRAEPADPERETTVIFDRTDPDSLEAFSVTLWKSAAEDANIDDILGDWVFLPTFDEAGNIINIDSINWSFDGKPASGYEIEHSAPAEYEFICEDPGIVINRFMGPNAEEDGYISITVNFTNNSNYVVQMVNPGESRSLSFSSKEKCTLDSLEVGDTVEIDFPVWTTANADGKGGGDDVEIHAYLRRVK